MLQRLRSVDLEHSLKLQTVQFHVVSFWGVELRNKIQLF